MSNKYRIPVLLNNIQDDSFLFKSLPEPTGSYPYRLDIASILRDKSHDLTDNMVFHMLGDTGSARHSDFQERVASALSRQLHQEGDDKPAFLYHLGDIVYNHGEAREYPAQFLKPYSNYSAPIFAIPGNHDADINPDSEVPYQSLDAFMDVFCDNYSRPIRFGGNRMSMVQPNVYWTLVTPLARFIGLYANVPKHGVITNEQRDWFIEELREADRHRNEQAIIVCVHHAPYSADTNHGSSQEMIDFLETAYTVSGVLPDLVCSGHVHNYQRFSKRYENEKLVPYIVAGAGGYADLHHIARVDDFAVRPQCNDGMVKLEAYCDDRFGFMKIAIRKNDEGIGIYGEYYTLSAEDKVNPQLYDSFEISVNRSAQLYM